MGCSGTALNSVLSNEVDSIRKSQPDRVSNCPECGQVTVDGEPIDHCEFSQDKCNTCGYAECDGSC